MTMIRRCVFRALLIIFFVPFLVGALIVAGHRPDRPSEAWEMFSELMADYWHCFKRGYL